MSELDVNLAGKSLADFTNTQLRLALGAVLYTNTADMWKRYLNQLGYSGDVSQMLQKYYVEYSVPQNFRNYINAGAFIYSPQQLFVDGSKGVVYDNNDFVDSATWRRNLLTYSEQFDNAAWTKSNASVTANAANNHLGVATADKLIPDAVSTQHRIDSPSAPVSSTTAYTVSCHAKADGYGFLVLRLRDAVSTADAIFNLSTGVVGAITISSWSAGSSSIESLGSGWYRCSFTATSNAAGATAGTGICRINVGNPSSNGDISAWAGNGTDGILIWGAQVEVGSTATTYQRITDFNSDFIAAFPGTTLFLDAAGTTAATVNGLVGLQLDKSANLALGAEVIPQPLDLTTGWTTVGTLSAVVVDGFTNTSGAGAGRSLNITTARWYRVTVTYTKSDSSTLFGVYDGSSANTIHASTASSGTLSGTYLATGAVYLRLGGNASVTITSMTLKEVAGNHRYQATTGSKPVLRGTPTGANLVTNGDFASGTAGWSALNATLSNPSGRLRVTSIAGGEAGASFAVPTSAGRVYRVTATYVTDGVTSSSFIYAGTSAFTAALLNVNCTGTTGTRVAYFTATGSTSYISLQSSSGALAGEFNEWDDVDVRDVTADVVTAPYGLQYDGVDDFMQTAAVDFTATDKMFVCAGVRKLSDAATAVVAELSVNSNSNAGAFAMTAPFGATSYGYQQGGTLLTTAGGNGFPPPDTSVISGVGDISGDILRFRRNGTQLGQSIVDQGTGNYGNYALYFGRRGGASLPYNGLDFGLVICGKTLTSNQISSTERYIAQRTGVTI